MSKTVNTIQLTSMLLMTLTFCVALTGPAHAETVYSKVPGVDCVINPFRVADVSSPVTGVIEKLLVDRSEQVNAGQPIAQLNADVERANVVLAQYRAQIRSEIELGRVNTDFDTSRKQRVTSLYRQKMVAVEDVDEVERESRLSRWRLEQARELARVRQLELVRAREQLQQKTIKAPFGGFIIDTFKQPGEHVEDQAILRLAQLDPLVVEAIVPMEYFGEIQTNMLAEIVPEILVDEHLTGTVSIIDRIGDTASNTFGVRLVVDNPDFKIPVGLKCIVKFKQEIVPEPGPESTPLETEQVPTTIAMGEAEPEEVLTDEMIPPELMAMSEPSTQQVAAPQSKIRSSYLVLAEQGETTQETRQLINALYAAGVRDLLEMGQGPYRGMISLGLYNTRTSADQHRQNLEKLGFNVFIHERQ